MRRFFMVVAALLVLANIVGGMVGLTFAAL